MGINDNKILIKGGKIIDGTGSPGLLGNVIINRDKIQDTVPLDIELNEQEYEYFNAADCIVCPGFIDAHAHDDIALVESPDQANKIKMGVTTVINGNCGVSVAPLFPENRKSVRETIVGVLVKSDKHCFPTMSQYISHLERETVGTNHATFVGHNTLRVSVLEKYKGKPTSDEMEKMKEMIWEAMESGALGLSTGLAYVPGMFATTAEVIELAAAVTKYNGIYSTHIRNEGDELEKAVSEAIEIASRAKIPLQLSHHKAIGYKNYGKVSKTLRLVESASRLGERIYLDQYPYTAVSTDLEALMNHETLDEETLGNSLIAYSEPFPELGGKTIGQIATLWEIAKMEAIKRLLPAIGINFCLSEKDICTVLKHPFVMVGSDGIPSEGFPHPRLYGTFARVLSEYVVKKNVLDLEEAIRKMTNLPAEAFGLKKRGKISKGYFADIAIFSLEEVKDKATYDNPKREATGFKHVFVNGECVLKDGKLTHGYPGRFLRGGQNKG